MIDMYEVSDKIGSVSVAVGSTEVLGAVLLIAGWVEVKVSVGCNQIGQFFGQKSRVDSMNHTIIVETVTFNNLDRILISLADNKKFSIGDPEEDVWCHFNPSWWTENIS